MPMSLKRMPVYRALSKMCGKLTGTITVLPLPPLEAVGQRLGYPKHLTICRSHISESWLCWVHEQTALQKMLAYNLAYTSRSLSFAKLIRRLMSR